MTSSRNRWLEVPYCTQLFFPIIYLHHFLFSHHSLYHYSCPLLCSSMHLIFHSTLWLDYITHPLYEFLPHKCRGPDKRRELRWRAIVHILSCRSTIECVKLLNSFKSAISIEKGIKLLQCTVSHFHWCKHTAAYTNTHISLNAQPFSRFLMVCIAWFVCMVFASVTAMHSLLQTYSFHTFTPPPASNSSPSPIIFCLIPSLSLSCFSICILAHIAWVFSLTVRWFWELNVKCVSGYPLLPPPHHIQQSSLVLTHTMNLNPTLTHLLGNKLVTLL